MNWFRILRALIRPLKSLARIAVALEDIRDLYESDLNERGVYRRKRNLSKSDAESEVMFGLPESIDPSDPRYSPDYMPPDHDMDESADDLDLPPVASALNSFWQRS